RVVAPCCFALAFVVDQVNTPAILCWDLHNMVFKQTFINCSQVAYREITIINKLSIYTSQHINGLLKPRIPDLVPFKKWMSFCIKETAIECRNHQWWIAYVDVIEELIEVTTQLGTVSTISDTHIEDGGNVL